MVYPAHSNPKLPCRMGGVYLFLGQDAPAKNLTLARLKSQHLAKDLEQFNFDTLYAGDRGLTPQALQEKLLCLPLKCAKRIVVIKDAHNLQEEVKEFLVKYCRKPSPKIILVIDAEFPDKKDVFIREISRYAKTSRFREAQEPDTFALGRQIDLRRPDFALKILNQLLKNGERPERILGGLRYICERDSAASAETRRRLRLLLNCDTEIKTGRLKPGFALEKLVISLCGIHPGVVRGARAF